MKQSLVRTFVDEIYAKTLEMNSPRKGTEVKEIEDTRSLDLLDHTNCKTKTTDIFITFFY